uniref:Uncharacterized protein n=1 Tax=Romanomermis culicivorax TaxID=13658 RepID=A0A915I4M6_ROMCU
MNNMKTLCLVLVVSLLMSTEMVVSANLPNSSDQRQGPILVANDPESILLMKAYKYLADAADVLEMVLQKHKKTSSTLGKRDGGDNGDWEFMRFGK